MTATIDMPDRWDYFVDATYFKIGRFDFVYMWNNKGWQRSQRTVKELKPRKVGTKRGSPRPGRIFKKDIVLNTVIEQGTMSKLEIIAFTGVKPSSVTHALKDLCGTGKLVYIERLHAYSTPIEFQGDLFRGLKL